MKLSLARLGRFCLVGAIGTIPNFILYTIFKGINIWFVNLGWVIGILAGMITNYILNERWTWK